MINNKKLLVDKDCPMCHWYSNKFVKTGGLKAENIAYYQTVGPEIISQIDMERAKAEIAYYDAESGATLYGVDAIIDLIAVKQFWLNTFLNSPFIYPVLKRAYAFISHNRKIIYPAKTVPNERACAPVINTPYRWIYIILVALVTAIILNAFSAPLLNLINLKASLLNELLICLGQIAWQGMAFNYVESDKRLNYLGNMSTVSMMGGLLLLPLLFVCQFVNCNIYLYLLYFLMVLGFMFIEHLRRCKILELPIGLSFSWLAYRAVVLLIIFLISIL